MAHPAPPWPPDAGRRALLAVLAVAGLPRAGAASVNVQRAEVPAQQTRTVLTWPVARDPAQRYLTLEFWLQPALQRAQLRAPDGRLIELGPLLRRLPAEQSAHPERGDLYILTDILRDPAPGTWELELTHAAAARPHALQWQAVLQPRHRVSLRWLGGAAPRSGVDADVVVEITDYGRADALGRPGPLRMTAPDGRQLSFALAPSPGGEPGRYEARIPLRMPGALVLDVEATWPAGGGGAFRARATQQYEVAPGDTTPLALRLEAERDAAGCWQALHFVLPWSAPAPGPYVLAVVLPRAGGGEWRVTGSVDAAAPGPLLLRATVRGSRLADLPPGPLREVGAVEVVQASGASAVLLRRGPVPVPPVPQPPAGCR